MKSESKELVVEITIPRNLGPIVSKILENRRYPDDDGMTEVVIMKETGCSIDEMVKSEGIVGDFIQEIRERLKNGK